MKSVRDCQVLWVLNGALWSVRRSALLTTTIHHKTCNHSNYWFFIPSVQTWPEYQMQFRILTPAAMLSLFAEVWNWNIGHFSYYLSFQTMKHNENGPRLWDITKSLTRPIIRWNTQVMTLCFFRIILRAFIRQVTFFAFDNTRMCIFCSFSTIDDVDYSWHYTGYDILRGVVGKTTWSCTYDLQWNTKDSVIIHLLVNRPCKFFLGRWI